MNMKWLGALVCVLALAGAVWHFSRSSGPSDESPMLISTSPQPIALFAQGLKISPQANTVNPEGKTEGAKKARSAIMTNEEIEETLLKYQRQFQNCWTQRLKSNAQLKGRILIHMTLSPSGKVSDVDVPQSDIQDNTMIQCLKSVVSRISFREFSGNPITLSLPLDFSN